MKLLSYYPCLREFLINPTLDMEHMVLFQNIADILTLYLMGGGIECLPLAKIAPVHQGVTFLMIFFDDNSYLYIYY